MCVQLFELNLSGLYDKLNNDLAVNCFKIILKKNKNIWDFELIRKLCCRNIGHFCNDFEHQAMGLIVMFPLMSLGATENAGASILLQNLPNKRCTCFLCLQWTVKSRINGRNIHKINQQNKFIKR